MRSYITLIKMRFILLLQYRAAAFAGVCTHVLFGFVRVMILIAFFSNGGEYPLNLKDTVTYVWLSQSLLGMFPWNGDKEIQAMIKTGGVAYELCRPTNLYFTWYSRALALRIAPTILKSFPIFLFSMIFLKDPYRMYPPESFLSFVLWIIGTILALFLSCAITNIITILTLFTISGEGLNRILPSFITFFSGMIVPLPLFPDGFKKVLEVMPFSSVLDVPLRLYIGDISPDRALYFLALQLVWILVLVGFGYLLLKKALKKVEIMGG